MPNRQPTSRSCFVCGRENNVGLKVKWDEHPEAGELRGTVTIPEHFNGYPGVTHGGIVAAVLDETAGRTILMDGGFDDLMVTAKLEVVYHGRPARGRGPAPAALRHAGGGGGGTAAARRDGGRARERAARPAPGRDHRALGGGAGALAGGLADPGIVTGITTTAW